MPSSTQRLAAWITDGGKVVGSSAHTHAARDADAVVMSRIAPSSTVSVLRSEGRGDPARDGWHEDTSCGAGWRTNVSQETVISFIGVPYDGAATLGWPGARYAPE